MIIRAILKVLDACEVAEKNLRRHTPGYPSADQLRSVAKRGVDGYGMSAAADQLDNAGTRHIATVLERDDPRPVWFCAWGGGKPLGGVVMKLRSFMKRQCRSLGLGSSGGVSTR